MPHTDIGRRQILLGMGLAPWVRRTGLSLMTGGAALTVSAPAHAIPWAVALSAASALSGLIASSQKGDGGVSATLNASLDYLRVMSGQLTSIQTALANIMQSISALDQKFRDALSEQQAKELNQKVATQIASYANEYERYTSSGFATFSAWQKDSLTKKTLYDINTGLENAVNAEGVNGSLGPLTAHQLPAAMFCAMAVRVGLGDSPASISVLVAQYLRRFERCADGNVADSTMAQMNAALGTLRESAAQLKGLGVEIPPETVDGATSFVDRKFAVACQQFEKQPSGDCQGNCTSVSFYSRLYRAVGRVTRGVIDGAPSNDILVRPLVVGDISLEMLEKQNRKKSEAFPGVPSQTLSAEVNQYGSECPTDDAVWMKSALTALKPEQEKIPAVRLAVNTYNFNLAQVALCSTALAGLLVARQAALRSLRT